MKTTESFPNDSYNSDVKSRKLIPKIIFLWKWEEMQWPQHHGIIKPVSQHINHLNGIFFAGGRWCDVSFSSGRRGATLPQFPASTLNISFMWILLGLQCCINVFLFSEFSNISKRIRSNDATLGWRQLRSYCPQMKQLQTRGTAEIKPPLFLYSSASCSVWKIALWFSELDKPPRSRDNYFLVLCMIILRNYSDPSL